jgi:NAD(P)-dependent dehydrogenase (short-subunit alcohol dehydrogenase family)
MGVRRRLNNALKALVGIGPPPYRIPAPETTAYYDPELLRGNTVLVTGAGRNIGRAIALEMARHGATVIAVDMDAERLRGVQAELAGLAKSSAAYQVDMSDLGEIDSFCERMRGHSVQVDALINNVGIGDNAHALQDLDVERWRSQFDTNVFGPLHLTRQIVQSMVDGGRTGSVLFITSIHQEVLSRNPAYSASKAALGMIVRELAVELSPTGIRVNGLAPGWTRESDNPSRPGHQDYVLLTGSPIPPRYIGRAAVYLTADYFSLYTTGSVLTIDAGLCLHTYRTAEVPPSFD